MQLNGPNGLKLNSRFSMSSRFSRALDIDAGIAQRFLDEQRKVAQEQIQQLLEEAQQDVPNTTAEVLGGLPSGIICQVAKDKKCDLIVTGTHGWTGFNRVVFGSVAERVIQRGPCPVLCIPHRESQEISAMHSLNIQPKHVVLPLNFSDCSMDAYEYAVQFAKWFDTPLTLIHAIEPLSYSLDFTLTHPLQETTKREQVKNRLTELTEVLAKQGLTANYELLDKPTVEAILEISANQETDLILMGTHGRKGLTRLILGSRRLESPGTKSLPGSHRQESKVPGWPPARDELVRRHNGRL